MSKYRHGCGVHFYKKYQEKTVFIRNNDGKLLPAGRLQGKNNHANLIYLRWKNRETKIVASLRTGVSYNSRYCTRNAFQKIKAKHTNMYNKELSNFQINLSPNPRTAKKQKKRFERPCRRVLSSENIKPGGTSNHATKLAAARKNKFLFLNSQTLRIGLRHLKFNKIGSLSSQQDYPFNIPYYNHVNTRQRPEDSPVPVIPIKNKCPEIVQKLSGKFV
ncbi:hypothetical protein RhiirA4_490981 [Rhizophagus irregularis]|uniref:DUF8211 domain-containing protein n=1 Tax=Rhizophagus irregularis TaxID=588596 RepID=A0A2I1HW32_9GLOM|nr:hypothetical protein RhiirA4_490981 [Rhizophagus irregularis]